MNFTLLTPPQNFSNPFFDDAAFTTLSTLKLTVLLRGRHSPIVTTSPGAMSLKKEKGFSFHHALNDLPEARGAVHRHVLVTLLVAAVLRHEVKIVSTNDDRSLHLALHHHSGENSTTDRDISSPRALLVDVGPFYRLKLVR